MSDEIHNEETWFKNVKKHMKKIKWWRSHIENPEYTFLIIKDCKI